MISKSNRFHGHNSLSTVYRKGQTVSLSSVSLKCLPVRGDKPHRLAVVVSRKVDKSAVVRNRIRRRLYESMRQKMPGIKQNYDMVLSVHNKQLADMKTGEVSELIDQLLIKSGLIEP